MTKKSDSRKVRDGVLGGPGSARNNALEKDAGTAIAEAMKSAIAKAPVAALPDADPAKKPPATPQTPENTFEQAFVTICQHYWRVVERKIGMDGTTKEALAAKSPEPMKLRCLIKDGMQTGHDTFVEIYVRHEPNPDIPVADHPSVLHPEEDKVENKHPSMHPTPMPTQKPVERHVEENTAPNGTGNDS